jgi:hypothetical protein
MGEELGYFTAQFRLQHSIRPAREEIPRLAIMRVPRNVIDLDAGDGVSCSESSIREPSFTERDVYPS